MCGVSRYVYCGEKQDSLSPSYWCDPCIFVLSSLSSIAVVSVIVLLVVSCVGR